MCERFFATIFYHYWIIHFHLHWKGFSVFWKLKKLHLGAALCCLTLTALEATPPGEGEENTVASATEKAVSLHTVTDLIYQMREAQAEGKDLEAAFKTADHSSYGPYPKIVQWCLKDSKEAAESSSVSFPDLIGVSPDNAKKLMVERAGQNEVYAGSHARCDADIRTAFLQQTYDQIRQSTQWSTPWTNALRCTHVEEKARQRPNIPLNALLSSGELQRLRHQIKTSTFLRQKAEKAADKWLSADPEGALQAWKETLPNSLEFRRVQPARFKRADRTSGRSANTFRSTPTSPTPGFWAGLSAYVPSRETVETAVHWGILPVVVGLGYLLHSDDGTVPLVGDACIASPPNFLDLFERTCKAVPL